jgi:uncharacterized membrane protein
MDTVKAPVWIAPILGGIVLCLMSTASVYYVERSAPKPKALARDFILGAIIVMCIMQILPESVSNCMGMLMSFGSVFNLSSLTDNTASHTVEKVSDVVQSITPSIIVPNFSGEPDEIDVRVGIPNF